MNGTTGLRCTGFERLAPCLHPGESRQQSRMYIKYTARESTQQGFLHQAHKAGQAHHIDIQSLEFLCHRSLYLKGELILIPSTIHHLSRHAMLPSTLQDVSIGIIRKNNDNLGVEPTIFDSIENGLAITA